MIEQANNLYNHIQNISSEGVKDTLPYQAEFNAMIEDDDADSMNPDTEIMLTAQYFMYAKKVWAGLSAKETKDINWYLRNKQMSYQVLLNSLIDGKEVLNRPPVYRLYSLLKNQLKKYRSIKQADGFPVIDNVKKNLKKGDSSGIDAWTAQKIHTAMHLGKQEFVKVKKSEAVFIVYFTAWVDSEGQLNFRKDCMEGTNAWLQSF
jgi:murein L,D-transpeptidase YcbB/YkuD